MKHQLIVRLFFPLLLLVHLQGFALTEAEEITAIKTRLRADMIKNSAAAQADSVLNSMDAEGKWADINYADTTRTGWNPLNHLQRLASMAAAYQSEDNAAYHSPKMLDAISRGLNYWYVRKPESTNWYQNMIGSQLALMRILTLLDDVLPPGQLKTGISYFYDPGHVNPSVATGQNLVWFASEQLVRGVLTNSSADIGQASTYLQKEIRVSTEEGIQPDFSFHQHGAQLYNGGYGLGFINDSSYYTMLLGGTRWEFPHEKLDVLVNYMLEGQRYMVRGKWLDFSVRGREPSRKNTSEGATSLRSASERLAALRPDKAADFNAFVAHINGNGVPASFVGNKHFWRSDFMSHQRPDYYLSVRMTSVRMVGTELVNSENLKGYWLPFGLTYIVRRGDEYKDIWPVWDWARLPGVTAPHVIAPIKPPQSQTEKFVGGVSDGQYGAAAMDLNKMDTTGHKAWFLFDKEMVALGADISSGNEQPVATTLNQTLLHGPVVANNKPMPAGENALNAIRWLAHDDVGYIFPQPSNLTLKTASQTGSWKSINNQYKDEPVSADVFTLWLDHGVKPQHASYAYIVLPGASAEETALYARKNAVRIIANTAVLQAVRNDTLGVSQAVFHQAGKVNLRSGLSLSVTKPCLAMVVETGGNLRVSIANPTGESMKVEATLRGKRVQTLIFDLKDGAQGGMTQTQTVRSVK